MKKIIILGLILITCSISNISFAAGKYALNQNSIRQMAKVYILNTQGEVQGSSTGIFIDNRGFIVTTNAVLEPTKGGNRDKIIACLSIPMLGDIPQCRFLLTIVDNNTSLGIVFFKIQTVLTDFGINQLSWDDWRKQYTPDLYHADILKQKISLETVKIGNLAEIAHYPGTTGTILSITEGSVEGTINLLESTSLPSNTNSKTPTLKPVYIKIHAQLIQGNTGGALLFDKKNKFLGIHSFETLGNTQNFLPSILIQKAFQQYWDRVNAPEITSSNNKNANSANANKNLNINAKNSNANKNGNTNVNSKNGNTNKNANNNTNSKNTNTQGNKNSNGNTNKNLNGNKNNNSTQSYRFSDISDSPYAEDIEYLAQKEVVGGYEDGTFQPERELSREEFLKIILVAKYGEKDIPYFTYKCFTDLSGSIKLRRWSHNYICFAKTKKIATGYPNGNFEPTKEVIYVEALKMMLQTFGYNSEPIKDAAWYEPYLQTALKLEIHLKDTETDEKLTRGKMANLMANLMRMEETQVQP